VVAGGLAAKATNNVHTSSVTRLASPVTATQRWHKAVWFSYSSRPIARILGGVVLFQEKVDLLKKLKIVWTWHAKHVGFSGGLGACPPRKFKKLDAERLNLVEILANYCMLLDANNWYHFSDKYMLYLAIILHTYMEVSTAMVLKLCYIINNVYELDNIELILYITIPENSTKLIKKTWKEENQARMKIGINPCPNLLPLQYTSISEYGGEQD